MYRKKQNCDEILDRREISEITSSYLGLFIFVVSSLLTLTYPMTSLIGEH